ncbi:MAG: TetR family transcriptional regulator [Myxococcales bacterium]|jgi:AcrR family transcriptional regulator|nr:TetR family transcriptional regulator [Myxococcales bacterium]
MSSSADWLNDERQELAVDRILEAARGVFARDGIRGARMGKIAEAAGCARATLYRYFPNKEALLHAYMVHVAKDFEEILDEKLRGLRSLGDRLVEAVAVSVELIREREDVAPFFNEEGLGLTAQLTSNAAAMRQQLVRQIERESCSDRIQGTLRNDVSADEAAEWVTRTIFSFSVLPSEARSGVSLRKYLRKMLIPSLIEG